VPEDDKSSVSEEDSLNIKRDFKPKPYIDERGDHRKPQSYQKSPLSAASGSSTDAPLNVPSGMNGGFGQNRGSFNGNFGGNRENYNSRPNDNYPPRNYSRQGYQQQSRPQYAQRGNYSPRDNYGNYNNRGSPGNVGTMTYSPDSVNAINQGNLRKFGRSPPDVKPSN